MKRSVSLDVFRGFTVAFMILVNNPGSWSTVFSFLGHAKWHGLTIADLVFPFFLFAVGNAQALVLPKMIEERTSGYFFKKVWIRSIIIFFIGFILSWYPFFTWISNDLHFKSWTWINSEGDLVGVRVMGVLQRIALAYGISGSLIYFFSRKALTVSFILLIFYWIFGISFGEGDIYSLEGWFGIKIDHFILGAPHLYQGEGVPFDPEGMVGTIPSIAQVMLGFWVGRILVAFNPRRTFKALFKRGSIFIVLGMFWSLYYPINKNIWTGSYVLVTTGLAIIVLAILFRFLDQKQMSFKGIKFFQAFGKNPLFIFVLSGMIPKTLGLLRFSFEGGVMTPFEWVYANVYHLIPGDPGIGSLLFSLTLVGFYGLVAMWLDKKNIYIRV